MDHAGSGPDDCRVSRNFHADCEDSGALALGWCHKWT